MFDKGKREQRHEQEDATFNRMLLWLAGAVVVELLIMLVKQIYVDCWAGVTVANVLQNVFHVFAFLGVALTAAGIVWAVLNYRKGKSPVVPCICAAVAAGLWVLSVLGYNLYEIGMNIMMLLPAVAAVLIVVYFLYQRVFFLNTLLTAGGLRVMPADTSYLMTWITCGVTALAMALALALGTAAGFYLLFALVAWEFVQAVFYTVRLM